ncbi:MAG: SBBP repeat-containing protein [Bacteroidia bacterium]|nr:SBBP repeat-containing protein [Bacteroidia bacterium]
MKSLLHFSFFLIIVSFCNPCYSQEYQWANTIGKGISYCIIVDGMGNVYITGHFSGTADFDPSTGTANLISAGGNDIFFAKYDNNGNYLWAKRIGNINDQYSRSIAVDGAGNVYITGEYQGDIDFDPGTGTANLSGPNGLFFAKYDNNGNYIWAKKIGVSTSSNHSYSIKVDGSENVYITGCFRNTVDFNPGTGTANLTTVSTYDDIFFAKYDNIGNYLWAKSIGSTSNDRGYCIAIDDLSNVYITGSFQGIADFDPGSGTANLSVHGSNNYDDIFFAKYDINGNYLWAKDIGSTGFDYGRSIDVDHLGNVYITGESEGADFDPGTGIVNLLSHGYTDIFVAKYDNSGNYNFAKIFGGTNYDYSNSIAIDSLGKIYVAGTFQNTADFDPDAGITNLSSAGSYDIFFSKFDAFGNYLWAKNIGSTNSDVANYITFDGSGNVYITGSFQGTADFDPNTGIANLTAITIDAFFAKYKQTTIISQPLDVTMCEESSTSLSINASGTAPLSYQWQFYNGSWNNVVNGNPSGALYNNQTADTMIVSGTLVSGNYEYRCFISNNFGADTSNSATLTVTNIYTINNPQSICNGDSYIFNGHSYTISGIFNDTIFNTIGCDSIFVINLTVSPTYLFINNIDICNGETYNWHGNVYTITGTYYDSLNTINGCDSIFILNLTVNQSYSFAETQFICNGENYNWHGNTYFTSGIYYDSLQTVNNCDSIYILSLDVSPLYNTTNNVQICDNQTYNWHGIDYSIAGVYYDSLISIHGCDSISTLNLTVYPAFNFDENHSICNGVVYNWHGNNYTTSGTYFSSHNTINGCDSIYTLNLTVNPVYSFSENYSICGGESYNWHNSTYSIAGHYYDSLLTTNSCDSIFELNLSVVNIDTSLTVSEPTVTANMNGSSYQWLDCDNGYAPISGEINQNFTATVNGNYAVIITQGLCSDTSYCVYITTVGVYLEKTDKLFIYPNPVSNELIIEYNGNFEKQNFEIINSIGEVVFQGNLIQKTIVNTTGFTSGFYLLKLSAGNSFKFRKFAKD